MSLRVRQIVLFVGLLGVLLSTHGGLVARVLFEIRHTYIAAQHCENRNVPDSPCKGQCFLKKRLAEAAERQEQQQATFTASPVAFFVPPAGVDVPAAGVDVRTFPPAAAACTGEAHPQRIDPPPRLA